jgi:hypothetical protein
VTGRTPLDYLHMLRVERARMLLEVTLHGTQAIAEACGYSDAAAFRRLFARAMQMSMSEYRQRFALRTRRRYWRMEDHAARAAAVQGRCLAAAYRCGAAPLAAQRDVVDDVFHAEHVPHVAFDLSARAVARCVAVERDHAPFGTHADARVIDERIGFQHQPDRLVQFVVAVGLGGATTMSFTTQRQPRDHHASTPASRICDRLITCPLSITVPSCTATSIHPLRSPTASRTASSCPFTFAQICSCGNRSH